MKLVLTGGAGFMGSAVAHTLVDAGHDVLVLDAITYAGDWENLHGLALTAVHGDVCDPELVARVIQGRDRVIHMAAETHVDRSLADARPFVRTNIEGTRVILEACRAANVSLIHVSTDEVFGSADGARSFAEKHAHAPGNPYAATKSAAESLVQVWARCFGTDTRVIRCVNNYGPRQHREKVVPNWIECALAREPMVIHGDGSAVRDWLHVSDFASAMLKIIMYQGPRRVFHLAGQDHRSNLELAGVISEITGARWTFGPERVGQDARYALDDAGTRADLGWSPRVSLAEGLQALWDDARRRA